MRGSVLASQNGKEEGAMGRFYDEGRHASFPLDTTTTSASPTTSHAPPRQMSEWDMSRPHDLPARGCLPPLAHGDPSEL